MTPALTYCTHCGTPTEAGVPSCPFCAQPIPVAALPAWRRNAIPELVAVGILFAFFATFWILILVHDHYR